MQLIGAGLPRTATLSQKIALEMLGLRPCYHMVDVLADLGRARRWTELLEGGGGWDEVFAGCEDGSGTGSMARAMERYNAEVRASVPADRLLVWSVADGWAPLCEFLEVPVPDSPFPRVNDSAAFADRIIDSSLALLCDWRLPDGRAAASA